jgi:outer membrane protein assembly factor BamE
MHKDDVAILMGTSLINPMFNLDRWDYAYTTRVGSGKVQVKHLVLYFHQDVLAEVKQ